MREYFLKLATDQENDLKANFLKAVLRIISWIYGLAVCFILFCYRIKVFRTYVLPKPVISVGNITLGGVGKTPFVKLIAKILSENNVKPAILTRGYMGKDFKGSQVGTQSDEAVELQESLPDAPVLVGANRYASALEGLKKCSPDAFILDDGFQHWRLKRDLDIVLIDATNPFGNHNLIVRGILREPLSSLKRADVIVLTKTDAGKDNVWHLKEILLKMNPDFLLCEAVHQPVCFKEISQQNIFYKTEFISQERICAVSSVGNPSSFEFSLSQLGAQVVRHFAFMDHHIYRPRDIDAVKKFCAENKITFAVTTQKDAVKLRPFLVNQDEGIKFLALHIEMRILSGYDQLKNRILRLFHR